MKRIGYLVSEYPTLSHSFIRREIAELRRLGLDVVTFSLRRSAHATIAAADRAELDRTTNVLPASVVDVLSSQGAALLRHPLQYARVLLAAFRDRRPGVRALLWSGFYFCEALLLARALEKQGVQHLHSHFANAGAEVGALAARFLGIPWSLTLHGTCDFEYPASVTLGRKIEQAAFVACVSSFGRAQAMRAVPASSWHKIHVVRCGVDSSTLTARRPQRERAPELRLLAVGRLAEEKWFTGLLQAFSHLASAEREIQLHIVGDGPERASLEARAAELGLTGRVRLRGALAGEDLMQEYCAADVFVSSSLMEGLPVVLMEAMLVGLPVVAPSVGGIPELVVHEQTGLLFDPGDSADLAEQIQRLLDDPQLRDALVAAGAAKARAQHDLGVAVLPLVELFGPES